MSQPFETRLKEYVVWFHENRNRGRDLDKERDFLKTAIDGCLELLVLVAEDLRGLEGRPKESLGRRLWTPAGMTLQGDVTRFG